MRAPGPIVMPAEFIYLFSIKELVGKDKRMDRHLRFAMSRNFAVFYGRMGEEQLSCFQTVILEPSGHTPEAIQRIRSQGTLVLAYLSMLEIPPWSPDRSYLCGKDYLQQNGSPLIYESSGNYWVDFRSRNWSNLLLHKISYFLSHLEYDGIFFDTLGDVEEAAFPFHLREETITAVRRMLDRVREVFPRHILVQNGGTQRIIYDTAPYLDGICWENPLGGPDPEPVTCLLLYNLKKIKDEYNIQILMLIENEHNNIPAARKIAADNNFLFYHADCGYSGRINTDLITDSIKKEGLSRCLK